MDGVTRLVLFNKICEEAGKASLIYPRVRLEISKSKRCHFPDIVKSKWQHIGLLGVYSGIVFDRIFILEDSEKTVFFSMIDLLETMVGMWLAIILDEY